MSVDLCTRVDDEHWALLCGVVSTNEMVMHFALFVAQYHDSIKTVDLLSAPAEGLAEQLFLLVAPLRTPLHQVAAHETPRTQQQSYAAIKSRNCRQAIPRPVQMEADKRDAPY